MSELDRVEGQAIRDVVVLGGGRSAMAGGALCVAQSVIPIPEFNRALLVGAQADVAAVAAWFAGHRVPHIFQVPPGHPGVDAELAAHGYEPGYAWMKFERDASPAPTAETDLRVEETLDADAFALACAEGFGLPAEHAGILSAMVGAPGWHCFVAWDGDTPAACGALYADGGSAWLGVGATRPAFRRRGAQSALLTARIDAARALGATLLTTETGELQENRPSQSYRNILRAGFREAYVRPNWRSPE